MKTVTYIVISIILFAGCSNSQNKLRLNVEKWQNKIILIPDTLPVMYKNDTVQLTKDFINLNVCHIVTVIDGNCYQCIELFEMWQDMIDEHPDIQYLFIVKAHSYRKLSFYLEQLNFDYPIILDKNNTYETINSIDDFSSTVLLDKEQKIVLVGNPIVNENLKELYLKEAKKIFFLEK